MKLIDQSGNEVLPGQSLTSFRGEVFTLLYGMEPKTSGSTGRVVVLPAGETDQFNCREFFPSVFECKFVADAEVAA